ncbi:small-conductance calcium-activated potassium channel protein [Stylonychia lemnae]|uniref:Small-conductance calcium-activated potassium channel protein n=1 Tax=Stylonychia lemnae TaxID=5949 RepID=A0A078BBZ2_STYLE|nr:small-conductance calcium-activated potassium channel protein [Stylonychia lemnae]|eukprot:CDW91118.1 small-conductance calcium-activated potassium channel protein [Stylonychia lemnae]
MLTLFTYLSSCQMNLSPRFSLNRSDVADLRDVVLGYNCICTIGLVLTIYIRYDLNIQIDQVQELLSEHDNLYNTGQWKSLIQEILIVIISPYPGLYDVQYIEYNEQFNAHMTYDANDLLLWCCFSRLYLVIRYSLLLTYFMGPRSQRICRMNGCDASLMFAVRSVMKKRPYTVIFVTLIITTGIFAFQLNMFEAQISDESGQNFNSFFNCIWVVIITLTTTGYGDIYPKTYMGRVTCIVICFWGMFIVSYFVVTLTNQLNFTDQEQKSYILLERLHHKEQLKLRASNVLKSSYRNKMVKANNPENKAKRLQAMRIFRMHSIQFQHEARKVRSYQESITDIDTLQKYIENVQEQVIDLSSTFGETQEHLNYILDQIKVLKSQKQTIIPEESSQCSD